MHCLPPCLPFCLNCSSTLATVGAIAGVGVWEGRSGFNGLLFVKMVSGWVLTIIAATSLTCECCGCCMLLHCAVHDELRLPLVHNV
jgi:phosphate/sulfate permease